eukprot:c20059_g1_i4.p2 GENE.c20059_g1_i4~~c20059_g1_i4.p2  ORF type:complete len:161 (-),score=30.16 c20059_g1_i4:266-748(-)
MDSQIDNRKLSAAKDTAKLWFCIYVCSQRKKISAYVFLLFDDCHMERRQAKPSFESVAITLNCSFTTPKPASESESINNTGKRELSAFQDLHVATAPLETSRILIQARATKKDKDSPKKREDEQADHDSENNAGEENALQKKTTTAQELLETIAEGKLSL